ncbi:MAG: hypothetical protein AVDCRST_MAG77-4928 [uncultured Chloroflexi bacterium]|uniref:Potassium channel domain-containing protein n=1 Tax=uncultured Chloroflexota bacterium TaxID=166587 RepID=A0A6J4K1Z4_9CHLR|nr:MAG: hypothetical protein AVDCRST_MAG77-4928 [uncultured Chloroflexota bacterium]
MPTETAGLLNTPGLLAWIAIPFGLLLIGVSLADIGLTVLHVQAESPVSSKLTRGFWTVLAAVCRPMGRRVQGRVLALGMPLMIALTLAFWVVCSVLGFALLFAPFIGDPRWFASGPGQSGASLGVADALYFSAVSFLTIGFGDVVPLHPLVRWLAVSEGAFGLLTISLSVTYLLSLYPWVTRKMALTAVLNQEAGGRVDGAAIAQRYVLTGRQAMLADRLRWLNDELLMAGQAHSSYPLLFFVRPQQAHESFVRALAVIQGIVCTLRYLLDDKTYPDVVNDPQLLVLEEGLLYTLHRLDRSSHLVTKGTDPDAEAARVEAEQRNVIAALSDAGVAVVRLDQPERLEAAAGFRAATDPYILAYARNVDYRPEDIWTTYDRWERDSALKQAPKAA